MQSMRKVFPDREVVDLDDKEQIFHSIYDLDDRYQVPGASPWFGRGVTYEQDGYRATWRGIYDDHNRLMVAICHNMDLGDSWEHADNPQYPEKFSALGHPHRDELYRVRDDALSRLARARSLYAIPRASE